MILFDLDGTLIDTTDLILRSFAHAYDVHFPGRLPSREALIATFGRSLPATLREMAAAEGAPDPEATGDAMLATYRDFQHLQHDTLIRPFPGVADMLAMLTAGGHRLGLVTSKREGFARRGLQIFGLEAHFDVCVFHDDTNRHKPLPDPLLLAAERGGVAPSRVVYVGDSTHDIVAGRAAGMRTVAALWGPFQREILEAERPDHLIDTPADLVTLLADWLRGA
jgi:pyrophosphatase PpaX